MRPLRVPRLALGLLAVAVVAVAVLAWRGAGEPVPRVPTVIQPLPTPAAGKASGFPRGETAVVVGAADIAECGDRDDEDTADLVERIPGIVFAGGDNAYPRGSARDYRECYEPSWGRFRERTKPVAGNHEYETRGAAGHVEYWGTAARPEGAPWYAFDAGTWRVVVLDSNCEHVDCSAASEQVAWLEAELAASDARCTLALFHHPLFSSGDHGPTQAVRTFWARLEEGGAELIVNGHDHDYERFAPQLADGTPDGARGIRQFVVGTGGGGLRDFRSAAANSEVRESETHGVIRLALEPDGYRWDFIPVAGRIFTDSGSGTCH